MDSPISDGHPVPSSLIWSGSSDFSKLLEVLKKRLKHGHGRTEDDDGAVERVGGRWWRAEEKENGRERSARSRERRKKARG